MEDILAKLVAIPTITGDIAANDQALDYIEDYLTERGLHAKRFRFGGHGALVATTCRHRKTPTIMLAAHVDVVPGDPKLFTLRQEGDKLFGRGVYDMKCAIAAYMQLVDDLRDKLDDYDFGVMITTNEEWGDRDGINGTKRLMECGYVPQAVVLLDGGSDYKVERVAKGYWRFLLHAAGRTGHGSRPWEGDSASFKLISALHELTTHFAGHDRDTDTLNIGSIHGGETFNQIPDSMTAAVEIRLVEETSRTKYEQLVSTLCRTYKLTYETKAGHQPTYVDMTNPFVRQFMQSIETITGQPIDTYISAGGSDAYYYLLAGTPCAVTYPVGGRLHSEDEWLSRESFAQLPHILRDYINHVAYQPAAGRTKTTYAKSHIA